MRLRLPDGSVINLTDVPRNTLSRRQSKVRFGKIKWPDASRDTRNVIRAIYDEKAETDPKTRVVDPNTGMRDGKPYVPIPTNASYSMGRGGAGSRNGSGKGYK